MSETFLTFNDHEVEEKYGKEKLIPVKTYSIKKKYVSYLTENTTNDGEIFTEVHLDQDNDLDLDVDILLINSPLKTVQDYINSQV